MLFLHMFCPKTKNIFFTLLLLSLTSASAIAAHIAPPTKISDKASIDISGYTQMLLQMGQENASMKIGKPHSPEEGAYTRMGIRRGYLKLRAKYMDFSGESQFKATEKSVGIYTFFLKYAPRQLEGLSFTLGQAVVPFGAELKVSSKERPTYERFEYNGDLFPGDVDLGLLMKYELSKSNRHINIFTLNAGLVKGNSSYGKHISLPDYVMDIAFGHKSDVMKRSYGLSGYYGYTAVADKEGNSYHARRAYLSSYIQYDIQTSEGDLSLLGEYVIGKQAGSVNSNKTNLQIGTDIQNGKDYKLVERPFHAALLMSLYRLKSIPIELIARYEYYNRNSQLQHLLQEAQKKGTIGEINMLANGWSHKLLLGGNYFFFNNHLRLSLHYEINKRIAGYSTETEKPSYLQKDDLLTLGVQFSF